MNLSTRQEGAALVVQVADPRIDAAVAIQFKDRMRALAAGLPSPERVVLDLRAVDFIDSSGLGAIVAVKRALDPVPLELAALTPPVERLFQLTRMVEFFHLRREADAPDMGAPEGRDTDAGAPAGRGQVGEEPAGPVSGGAGGKGTARAETADRGAGDGASGDRMPDERASDGRTSGTTWDGDPVPRAGGLSGTAAPASGRR
ncbi:STAS domain-containing protein [Frigidibacter sp. MR17.14]|uniref:STAS domain-containing protein n=1 Tax=Frigidibacter sp. MR17.14 TaxID=3126509 RepID=UPI003012B9E0